MLCSQVTKSSEKHVILEARRYLVAADLTVYLDPMDNSKLAVNMPKLDFTKINILATYFNFLLTTILKNSIFIE